LGLLAREGNSLNEFFRRLLDEQARSALPRAALPAVAAHIAATTLSPRLCNEQVYALASDLVDASSGCGRILTRQRRIRSRCSTASIPGGEISCRSTCLMRPPFGFSAGWRGK
jgi:hypothetical protein